MNETVRLLTETLARSERRTASLERIVRWVVLGVIAGAFLVGSVTFNLIQQVQAQVAPDGSQSVAAAVQSAVEDASVSSFRLAIVAAAALAVIGGLISAIWIRNPRRAPEPEISEACRACGRTGTVPVRPAFDFEETS